MTHFGILAFAIVLAMGAWTWLNLSRWPAFALNVFIAMTLGAFAVTIESAGQPKPLALEWRNVLDAPLVGLSWDEGRRLVWVWVMRDGQPVSYELPWPQDKKQFGQLQDSWRRRGTTGDEFSLQMDGEVAKVTPPKQNPEKTQ